MAFRLNSSQQLSLNDRFQQAPERTQKFVLKSWAKGFGDIVFPAICEERFAVLYSSDSASCPNTPVNILVGSLLLKELLQMTDEELLEAIVCGDLRFQYALHTTSFEEQPVSKNSFNRFLNRLYLHLLETGEDLLQQEMEALAEVFLQFLDIEPSMKRMDSLMVAANCRRMSRLELMYRCVQNLVKAIEPTDDVRCLKDNTHYLDPTDANQVFYHDTDRKTPEKLEELIQDAVSLRDELDQTYHQLPDYQLLCQVLEEQTFTDETGQTQQINDRLSLEDITNFISEAVNLYDLNLCVFTGGECTLLGSDLLEAIQFAHNLGLRTRIVSNGHWGRDSTLAVTYLKKLIHAGLDEINISMGDDHQKWVSFQNIKNIMIESYRLKLPVVVNVESQENSIFTKKDIITDTDIKEILDEDQGRLISILNGIWIPFRNGSIVKQPSTAIKKILEMKESNGCDTILQFIGITPNKEIAACCGLTMEYIPFYENW